MMVVSLEYIKHCWSTDNYMLNQEVELVNIIKKTEVSGSWI